MRVISDLLNQDLDVPFAAEIEIRTLLASKTVSMKGQIFLLYIPGESYSQICLTTQCSRQDNYFFMCPEVLNRKGLNTNNYFAGRNIY